MIAGLALSTIACSSGTKPAPRDLAPAAAPAPAAKGDARAQATAALRCEECHGRIATDWTASAHAGALRDPLYVAMLGGGSDGACARCHAPVRAAVPAGDLVAKEAVGCDGCHLVQGVEDGPAGASFRWAVHATTKYGPLCDAEDHYFHKMGCSTLHASSRFCAPCHEQTVSTQGGPIPVLTEHGDWAASDQGKNGLECQGCHMPSVADEVARGGKRVRLHDHRFATRDQLVARALEVDAWIEGGGLTVRLKNVGAGHAVPAGMPERRLVVRTKVLDQKGLLLAGDERVFGRVLVDDAGLPAPFTKAVRVASDTRLAAGEQRDVVFQLPPRPFAKVEVAVVERRVAKELLAALGGGSAATEELVLARKIARELP